MSGKWELLYSVHISYDDDDDDDAIFPKQAQQQQQQQYGGQQQQQSAMISLPASGGLGAQNRELVLEIFNVLYTDKSMNWGDTCSTEQPLNMVGIGGKFFILHFPYLFIGATSTFFIFYCII
jgi:hypothetical protein